MTRDASATPSYRRAATLVGLSFFTTQFTMVDRGVVGLPLKFLLKDRLGLTATQLATFMALALAPIYLKPLTGLLTDAFPILGYRRKPYLLLGSGLAALAWAFLWVTPFRTGSLLAALFMVMLFSTLVSTTTGAVRIEVGQSLGATGRLASVSSLGGNVANMGGALLGGYLAGRAFGWVCGLSAASFLLLLPLLLKLHRERPTVRGEGTSRPRKEVLRTQIRTLLNARPLQVVLGMMALVALAPGLGTLLFFIQATRNHFSPVEISWLTQVTAGFSLLAAFAYIWLAKHLPLQRLVLLVLGLAALAPLCYLHYASFTQAALTEAFYAFTYELCTILLIDLASRVTPKGSEGVAFGLLWSALMVMSFLADILGAWLFDVRHVSLAALLCVNGGTTAFSMVLLPLLPAGLLAGREQDQGDTQGGFLEPAEPCEA